MSERKHGDLISREVALNGIDKNIATLRHHAGNNCVANSAINLVQYTRDFLAALPAVDAVEVVRCKDCKYQGDNTSCPMLNAVAYTKDDDFCCAGRRGRKIKDICCGGCGAENGGKYENIPQNMLLKVRFPKDGE